MNHRDTVLELHEDICGLLLRRLEQERTRNPRETKRSALRLVLMSAIRDGTFRPGDRLPPETEMASRLSLAPGTVQNALGQLQDLGLIVRRRGDGTRVADSEPMGPNIWHFRFGVKATGRPLRITSTRIEVLRTNDTGAWTHHLGEGPYNLIRRQLSGDGVHVGAEMYLPASLLNIEAIELSELEGVNLRTHLEGMLGKRTQKPETRVGAMALSLRHAAMFDLTPDMPVLHIEARTMLNDGTPFYFQNIYGPSELLTLEF
ncbi:MULTISPECIES: GntR family transcriptional regulator [Roseobacteraceae]|uniref:Pyruvate dehydrogenase complex repressor n=1 Tax=Pseudosulfitobacter pseudonitzschiae TaxID=1402135 RepID=A0A221K856_9RHOB|nr:MULTISPECIES: GntR family transcriptional regulator [Roseobacteraceae]ASM75159.1 pyruvate dehydrogenase complex repressor [Pseudosulfitobacter pseudonitzschiae]